MSNLPRLNDIIARTGQSYQVEDPGFRVLTSSAAAVLAPALVKAGAKFRVSPVPFEMWIFSVSRDVYRTILSPFLVEQMRAAASAELFPYGVAPEESNLALAMRALQWTEEGSLVGSGGDWGYIFYCPEKNSDVEVEVQCQWGIQNGKVTLIRSVVETLSGVELLSKTEVWQ